jgi:DNA-binding NarL/FixJ family response regulator
MTRVVVVDDHAVVRTGLSDLLATTEDLTCVGTACDGASALELIARVEPDVVVLDLSMPDVGGVAVARALRRSGNDVRILVLTSFGDAHLVIDAVQAGADGYLLKQAEAEVILDGVRAVANGRGPLDASVAPDLMREIRERAPGMLLTAREREVLELLRLGRSNRSIARSLGLSERTVKVHIAHIFLRIGVSDRTQAALWAERHWSAGGVPMGAP